MDVLHPERYSEELADLAQCVAELDVEGVNEYLSELKGEVQGRPRLKWYPSLFHALLDHDECQPDCCPCLEIGKRLLAAGVEVDGLTDWEGTPLTVNIICSGKLALLDLLPKIKTDGSAKCLKPDEAFKYLVAAIQRSKREFDAILSKLENPMSVLYIWDEDGPAPLSGTWPMVPDPYAHREPHTALFAAVRANSEWAVRAILREMHSHPLTREILIAQQDLEGDAAAWAAHMGYTDILRVLDAERVDLAAWRSREGHTLVHVAGRANAVATVAFLKSLPKFTSPVV